jgi:hypothetical protein
MKKKPFIIALALVLLLTTGWFVLSTYHLIAVSVLERGEEFGWASGRFEETFTVGSTPTLKIDNFAGAVSVHAGESGVIQVVAYKSASSERSLERVAIDVIANGDGLEIRTSKLLNTTIRLEITTPVNTHLEASTLFGNLEVRDLIGNVSVGSVLGGVMIINVTGEVFAGTAAGGFVNVHGATGPVHLSAAVGGLYYDGTPTDDCTFTVGGGRITLVLPNDLNAEIDMKNGRGPIDIGFDVDGRATRGKVNELKGIIGSGDKAKITAVLGGGGIYVFQNHEN